MVSRPVRGTSPSKGNTASLDSLMAESTDGAVMKQSLLALPLALILSGPTIAPAGKTKQPAGPPTPKEAQAAFKIEPGLRIELVACEPQIESPVAMAFGEDGRLWVVEMRDYPNGPAKGEKPAGRIRVLEDRDGDG